MRNISFRALTALLVLVCLPPFIRTANAQQSTQPEGRALSKPDPTYKIAFSIREVEDGKRLNDRNYSLLVADDKSGRIRIGNKVPVIVGPKEIRYEDVGMNIDCRLRARENGVLMDLTVQLSSVVKPEDTPVIRNETSSLAAFVPLGKPTMVSTIDDVSTNHRYEIEVTATKAN